MKILRRNEPSNNRGNLSGAEMKHMKAASLIQEFYDKSKRRPSEDVRARNISEMQQALNPKRLLCFSNKAKKDQNPEENLKQPQLRPTNITDYKAGQKFSVKDRRRNNGDLSVLCNELCRDYYEIRKKLKNRPVVLTPKKPLIQDAITGSNSTTSSSVDAPLRDFGGVKRGKSKVHYSNENRDLHRRQRSLMDDSGSVNGGKNKSRNRSNVKKSSQSRSSSGRKASNSIQSKSNRSKNSNRSDKSKSKSRRSNSLKANSKRSYGERVTQPEMSMSESTLDTVPVSVVERNCIQPDISMISTMTSKSYSTYNDSSIILSPRGANDKVDKNLNQSKGGLLVCSSTPCSSRPQRSRQHVTRNPSNPTVSPLDLRTIREGDDYYSSSASSASYSYYSSSSSGSYSDYSDSSFDEEEYDPSKSYVRNSHASKSISKAGKKKKKKENIITGCSTVASGDVWSAIMYDEGTTEERDDR